MEAVRVIAAALGGFAFGAVWYMALARPWMAAAGIATDAQGRPAGRSPLPFAVALAAMLIVAGMMRHVFAMSGIDGAWAGLVSGLGVGLFLIAPWLAMNYAYGQRPVMLTLIDGGYAAGGAAVIGLILGLF